MTKQTSKPPTSSTSLTTTQTGTILFGKQFKTPIIKSDKNKYCLEIELDSSDHAWILENMSLIKKHYGSQIKAAGAASSRASRQTRALLQRSDEVTVSLREVHPDQLHTKKRLSKEASLLHKKCMSEMMKQMESNELEKKLKGSMKCLKRIEEVVDSSDEREGSAGEGEE